MVLTQQELNIRNGYEIGMGVDMATGSPMALGAVGVVTPPQFGSGESGEFFFRRIDTTDDLLSEVGVSADVSAGIGLFSASASFDFAKRCRVQSTSLVVMVSAHLRFAFQQMDSPELSGKAAELQANGKPLDEQFGQYFVRGVQTGGRFFGVVRIETKTSEAKTSIDAALSGSYGLTMSADVKVNLTNSLKQFSSRTEGFLHFEGGQVLTRLTSSEPVALLDQLFAAMKEWTDTVRAAPQAYRVTVAPYVVALGPLPPNIVDIEHQRDVLIRCAKLRSQTMDKLNLVEYILDPLHIDEFELSEPSAPDLPALQAALARDLDAITEAASFAINNIKDAVDVVTFMRTHGQIPDFILTPLPNNMPKRRPGSPAVGTTPEIVLTVSPESGLAFPRELRDLPNDCLVSTKLTVSFPGPVPSGTEPTGMPTARFAGLALVRPDAGIWMGITKNISSAGQEASHTTGHMDGTNIFTFTKAVPVFSDSVHLRLTVVKGKQRQVELSDDGVTWQSAGGRSISSSRDGTPSPRQVMLFGLSQDGGSFTARFTEPKIEPLAE